MTSNNTGRVAITEPIKALLELYCDGNITGGARRLGMTNRFSLYHILRRGTINSIEKKYVDAARKAVAERYPKKTILSKIGVKSLKALEERIDADTIDSRVDINLTISLYKVLSKKEPRIYSSDLSLKQSTFDGYVYGRDGVKEVPKTVKDYLEKKIVEFAGDDLPQSIIIHLVNSGVIKDEKEFKETFPVLAAYVKKKHKSFDVLFSEESRDNVDMSVLERVSSSLTKALYDMLKQKEARKSSRELGIPYTTFRAYVAKEECCSAPLNVKNFLEQKVIETDNGNLLKLVKEHIVDSGVAETQADFREKFPALAGYIVEKYGSWDKILSADEVSEKEPELDTKLEEVVIEKGGVLEDDAPSKGELENIEAEGEEPEEEIFDEDEASEIYVAVATIMAQNKPTPKKKKPKPNVEYRGEDIPVTAEMAVLVRFYCYGHNKEGQKTSYTVAARHLGVKPSLFKAIYNVDDRCPKDPKKPIVINEGIIERIIGELGEYGASILLETQGIDVRGMVPDKQERLQLLILDYHQKSRSLPMVTALQLKQHDGLFRKYDLESLLWFVLGDVKVPSELIYPMHDYFKKRLEEVENGVAVEIERRPLATRELNLYVINYMKEVRDAIAEIDKKEKNKKKKNVDEFLDLLIDNFKLLQIPVNSGETRSRKKLKMHKILKDALGGELADEYSLKLFSEITIKKVLTNIIGELQDLRSA